MSQIPDDSLGALLVERGLLTPDQLEDVIEQQRHVFPVGSLCWVLGYATEEQLASVLWQQLGVPTIVLERCVIPLRLLDDLPPEVALRARVLPIGEDDDAVYVAAAKAHGERVLRELEFKRGKQIVVYAAVEICLDRTIRMAYAARERGADFARGAAGPHDAALKPYLHVIGTSEGEDEEGIEPVEELSPEDLTELEEQVEPSTAAHRVLVVDDETQTRRWIMRELEPLGVECIEAWSGLEAIKQIKRGPLDLVVTDVMLPEINGFQVCRSIKQSSRYRHIRVLLVSANLQSGQVDGTMLARYGADGFLEKPLDADRLREVVQGFLEQHPGGVPVERDARQHLELALEAYRRGHVDTAIAMLRDTIAVDPLSARPHLLLGDLLRERHDLPGAQRAYEAAVRLEPRWPRSLDRLASVYYKVGFHAKAAETWRLALNESPTLPLRARIERMLDKLDGKVGVAT